MLVTVTLRSATAWILSDALVARRHHQSDRQAQGSTSPLARIADITTVARERPEAVENLKNLRESRFWTFQD